MEKNKDGQSNVIVAGKEVDLSPVIKEINNPLKAMKLFREITGCGLRESIIYVDSYRFTGKFPEYEYIIADKKNKLK